MASVERVRAEAEGPVAWEHRSRYIEAATLAPGAVVLDIACGTGYGAAILLEAGAERVCGVDASAEAIQAARMLTDDDRFHAAVADGTDLPFPDRSFDLVVSFETVEHIDADKEFVSELARVASKTVLISTPNALHTRHLRGQPNPFHVREYSPDQFAELLAPHFSRVELAGQRPAPHLRPCPFWESPIALPRGVRGLAATTRWRLAARLPRALRPLLLNRPLLPGPTDFTFSTHEVETGHVLFARCSVKPS